MNFKSESDQQPSNEEQAPQLVRSFRGHKDKISQVLFNPNLRQLISASTDGMIMTWGLRPNSRPQKFIGHKGAVYDVAVNPTGTQLASASKDNTIRLWNNNAQFILFVNHFREAFSHVLKGHSAPVKSIQFNCDGNLLLSASDDKTLKIWSVSDKKFLSTLKGHTNWIRKAQFSFDSRMIASGSDDRTVKMWDVNQNGTLIHTFTDHTGMVSDVKFHPDGTCLASCGSDKKIKIFDVRSHRLLQHYDAHTDLINSVAFHPNGSYLLSTSNDGNLKIWDLRKGHILYTLIGHEGPTSSGTFSPGGDYFCSGGKDAVILIWKAGLNPLPTEILHGLAPARIETEVFVTDKEIINKIPAGNLKENRAKSANKRPQTAGVKKTYSPSKNITVNDLKIKEEQKSQQTQPLGQQYKTLKPEVQTTLDRIVSQVELVSKTLQLLEQRIGFSEDKMLEVMNHIKNNDLAFRPRVYEAAMSNANNSRIFAQSEEKFGQQSLIGTQLAAMNIGEQHYDINEGLKLPNGGEEFFRSTNVFATDSSQGRQLLQPGPSQSEFTSEQLNKIDTFLIKTYGVKNAQQIKLDSYKKKDLIRTILIKELNRTYKYPEAAFQALDFRGKGYLESGDFIEAKFIFRLPFNKNELREFLEKDTIFKKVPQLKIEMFTKSFFPTKLKEQNTNNQDSDSDQGDQNMVVDGKTMGGTSNSITLETNSVMSTTKNRDLTVKLKQIEDILKQRLSNNWVSVRKAFLDLDTDYDGYLTSEDFAKLIGGSTGSSKFDYNILRMLIRLKTSSTNYQINYTEFCKWFGAVIEPVEAFYFRHDSQKNPQYEKNQQKTVQQYAIGQKKIREIISNKNLKERFIDKLHHQFKSLQKAFSEMNKTKTGFVYYDEFFELIVSWGFDANEDLIKELFEWLDNDKDGKISFEDLRSTAGQDLAPMEALYFRQDAKPAKQITCKFEKCWENNNYNSKSQYCHLHQKVMRNQCLDKFSQIAMVATDDQWDYISNTVIQENFTMSLKQLSSMLKRIFGTPLNIKEKECIWESFKVKQYIEDNPDNIDERLVSLQAFLNARKQSRLKKINQMLQMEADDEQMIEDVKTKGLEQVDQAFVLRMAVVKKAQWGGIWKSIKKIDKDSNGYVTIEELDEIFREWFPVELEGKTLNRYFRQFGSIQNKILINYKKIKNDINTLILKEDKYDFERRLSIKDQKPQMHTTQSMKVDKQDLNLSSDDEQLLKIEGQSQALYEQSTFIPPSIKGRNLITIDSKRIQNESRSITPMKRSITSKKQSTSVSPLPKMNRNTSIQRINNLQLQDDTIDDEASIIFNNRSTTPVIYKAYGDNQNLQGRNKSQLKIEKLPMSSLSQISVAKSVKFNEDVKVRLAYEWKNIYRAVVQADVEKKGSISIGTFNKIIHQNKVYLSREELRKIEQMYSANQSSLSCDIDYQKISQELGLHKQSLDFIKTKNSRFIDQISKFRDTPSRGSYQQTLSKSLLSYPVTDRGEKSQILNQSQLQNKVKAASEFLYNFDKSNSGQIPISNFMKIMRIFGLGVNQSLIKVNEVGMVEYERALDAIMV